MIIMSFKIFFIVTIVILFIPVSGLCIDYYVNSTSGSDENSGLSPDNAWKTITYAISQVIGSESDTAIINISAGTYSPSTGEIFPIVMKDNVVLIGAGKRPDDNRCRRYERCNYMHRLNFGWYCKPDNHKRKG